MSIMSSLRTGPRKADLAKQPAPGADPFFDCVFLGSPRELAGSEPYIIFRDDNTDGFTETLVRHCRGDEHFLGVTRDLANITPDAVVICDGPTWERRFEMLQGIGVRGQRARVLLYFDRDASGFWDFAIACGNKLASMFRDGVTTQNIEALAPFLELWSGSRVSNGRLLPAGRFYTRDFLPLQIQHGDKIARVMAAMADDQSRTDYARILFGSAEQVFTNFADIVFGPQQYMDIVRLEPGNVVVNCGVSRGWEVPFFLARLKGKGHVHNIDPNIQFDSNPFAGFFKRFGYMMTNHQIIAGQVNGKVRFGVKDADMIMSDMTVAIEHYDGEFVEFHSRSIDSLYADGLADRLDYFKMDVEGGELDILKGSVETIRKYRPKLAVAIYHEPHHFWDYPNWILDNFENYRFYLRQYGYSRFETLLYAVPAEAVISTSGQERIRGGGRTANTTEMLKPPLLLAHFRDKVTAPREIYDGKKRILTRVFGVDWATAEFTPGPRVEADDVFGVIEAKGETVIFTRHSYGATGVSVTVGRSTGTTDVRWIADQGVPAHGKCLVVCPDEPERLHFLVFHPQDKFCDLYRFENDHIYGERCFGVDGEPVCARWQDGHLFVLCKGAAATDWFEIRAGFDRGAIGPRTKIAFEADAVEGVVALKSFKDGKARFEDALVVRTAEDKISAFLRDGKGLRRVLSFDWDSRFKLGMTYAIS